MNRSMRMIGLTAVAAITTTAALAASPVGDTATATVDGDTITVAGTLAEELAAIAIGADEVGDATGSGAGVDLASYAVSFPSKGKVAFHVAIGDANPATGYFPQSIEFSIAPTIGTDTVALTARAELDGGLTLEAETCEPDPATGVNNCSGSPVEGGYADGVITWVLPTNAGPDTTITGGTAEVNPTITTATTGGLIFNGGLIDTMKINAFAAIPSATLLVDGVEAGATRLGNAGYEVSASGVAAGEHTIAVVLCGGDVVSNKPANCTTIELGTITVDATDTTGDTEGTTLVVTGDETTSIG